MTRESRDPWSGRIARARDLLEVYPFGREILEFYVVIAELQADIFRGVAASPPAGSFGEPLDARRLLPWFPTFLSAVRRAAPAPLAGYTAQVANQNEEQWSDLLCAYWAGTARSDPCGDFLARAFLQPYAEHLSADSGRGSRTSRCPVCGRKAVAAVLREKAHGAARSLLCSFCSSEWEFERGLCVACGDQAPDALCFYSASGFETVRVDACRSCNIYLKTIDLTKDAHAVPIVDELATVPLDLWAQGQGYMKLERNLLGL